MPQGKFAIFGFPVKGTSTIEVAQLGKGNSNPGRQKQAQEAKLTERE